MPVFTRNKTWSVDEMANAVLLNQYHRDNEAATLHRLAYKTADETLASNTTLQNDNELFFSIYPNEKWYLRLVLICFQSSAVSFDCDIKVAFTFTAGALTMTSWTRSTGSGLTFVSWTGSGTPQSLYAKQTAVVVHVIEGYLQGGTAAPLTFAVQWAQNTSDAGPLHVYPGSTLWGANIS